MFFKSSQHLTFDQLVDGAIEAINNTVESGYFRGVRERWLVSHEIDELIESHVESKLNTIEKIASFLLDNPEFTQEVFDDSLEELNKKFYKNRLNLISRNDLIKVLKIYSKHFLSSNILEFVASHIASTVLEQIDIDYEEILERASIPYPLDIKLFNKYLRATKRRSNLILKIIPRKHLEAFQKMFWRLRDEGKLKMRGKFSDAVDSIDEYLRGALTEEEIEKIFG